MNAQSAMQQSATHSTRIRQASEDDAQAILSIYAPYIENTAITFETDVPTLDEFTSRMKGILGEYPYLVIEENGVVQGYAYAHRQAERAAYAWNAELSVYLRQECTGHGFGRSLSQAVCDLLELQGVRNVFSLITQPNYPSIRMHELLGFKLMGTQKNAGYKCGAWHDVAWLQKQIGSFEKEPARLQPLCETNQDDIERVIALYSRKLANSRK